MASKGSHAPRRAGSRRPLLATCMLVSDPRVLLLVMYLLLATCHVVMAQVAESSGGPTFAPPPSSFSETVSPSTITLTPSFLPTLNPTKSFRPSSQPSTSPRPTESMTPSVAPSKSSMPSSSPTHNTTTMEVTTTTELFNMAMVLEGFPFMNATVNETSTNKTLWEMITSDHVSTYWAQRNYTEFNITAITTAFQAQVSHFPSVPEDSDPTQVPEEDETKIVYDQRIIYWVEDGLNNIDLDNGLDSPVPDIPANQTNTTVLFIRPFETDSQTYCDNLQKAFNLSDRVFMLDFKLIPFETSPPTPSSPNGGGTDYTTEKGLDGGMVVAIAVVCIAFVALVLFFGVWYMTVKKEEHINQDENVREQGQMVVVDEPPGFLLQDSEYSEPVTIYNPAASDSHIPETDEPIKADENGQHHDRQGSLHVGIPVDDEGRQDVLSDDDDDDDDDEHSYYSEEDEMLGMSDMQQPSMTGFALQIHELEE